MTPAFAPLQWLALICIWLLLTGCSGNPLTEDAAFWTLPVPNPQTDCQVRVTRAGINGGGLMVQGAGQTDITTVIGAKNCPPGMGVPTTVPINPNGDLLRRLEAIERAVQPRVGG